MTYAPEHGKRARRPISSDAEWGWLEPHIPPPKRRGRPKTHTTREILDADLLCPQEWLPLAADAEGLPALGERLLVVQEMEDGRHLRATQRSATRASADPFGHEPLPSAGIADSQSAKSTGVGGEQRGYDGNKKVRGRKRHLLVDTEGLVLKAKVHSAKVPDQDGLRLLLQSARTGLSRLKHLWLTPDTRAGAGNGPRM